MRIGVIGSGEVGRVLGAGFALMGHEVKLGSRNPAQDKIRAWLDETGASAGTFDEAASFAEVAVLATLWEGTENAIRLAGPENLAGKVVIDATNPLDFSERVPPKLAIGHTDSGGGRCNVGCRARASSRRLTPWVTHTWSTPNSPEDRQTCSSAATTSRRSRQ